MAKQTFSVGQTLTAAQMTSLQQTAMLGGAASAKTASYTLVAADAGTAISMTSASATTITVNTALFAAGDTVQITNLGAGVCTITAGTATVNTSASLALAQYESGTLDFTSTSDAIFIKGAGAASGGMTLISNTVASANSSISLSSIPQTYKQLVLVWSGIRHSATGSTFGLRLNNNSGNIYHCAGQSGLTTNSATTANATNQIQGFCAGIYLPAFGDSVNSNSYEEQCMGYITIDNYTSSTLTPSVNVKYFYFNNAAAQTNSSVIQCQFNGGAAITSIDIVRLTGTATLSNQYNTISSNRLYGVS